MDDSGKGSIAYEPGGVGIHPSAPGFAGATAAIGDEEMVRAYLLTALAGEFESLRRQSRSPPPPPTTPMGPLRLR